MAYLTQKGETYLLKLVAGDYSAAYTEGYDKVGLYGSISSAADSLIDTVKAITWTFTVGNTSLNLVTDPVFTIPADTVVKGVIFFNTTEGVTFGDQIVQFDLSTAESYPNGGTFTLTSATYNFEHI